KGSGGSGERTRELVTAATRSFASCSLVTRLTLGRDHLLAAEVRHAGVHERADGPSDDADAPAHGTGEGEFEGNVQRGAHLQSEPAVWVAWIGVPEHLALDPNGAHALIAARLLDLHSQMVPGVLGDARP